MTRRPPRRAPCLTRHHQVTMRASFQRVGPGQAWIATSRRGWVIAAWVLGCRARFTDSSVKTTCDSLLGPSPGRAPRSALHLDDSGYLAVLSTPIRTQWKGPSASRKSGSRGLRLMPATCQPVAIDKIKLQSPSFLGSGRLGVLPPYVSHQRAHNGRVWGRLGVRFPPPGGKRSGLGAAGRTFPTTGRETVGSGGGWAYVSHQRAGNGRVWGRLGVRFPPACA
jgi:hypothetical protein